MRKFYPVASRPTSAFLAVLLTTALAGCTDLRKSLGDTVQTTPDSTNIDMLNNALSRGKDDNSLKTDPGPPCPKTAVQSSKPDPHRCPHISYPLVSAYLNSNDPVERRHIRDQITYTSLSIEDQNFIDYTNTIYYGNAGVSLLGDFAILGLTGAGAVAGSSANAISAAATAVTGAKTAYDKNFFASQTLPSLILSVVVTRARMRDRIQSCLALPDDQYPLPAAVFDVAEYHRVTNLPFAIADLTAATSSSSSNVQTCGAATSTPSKNKPSGLRMLYTVPPDTRDAASLMSFLVGKMNNDDNFVAMGILAKEDGAIPDGTIDLVQGATQYRWAVEVRHPDYTAYTATPPPPAPPPAITTTVLYTVSGTVKPGDVVTLTPTGMPTLPPAGYSVKNTDNTIAIATGLIGQLSALSPVQHNPTSPDGTVKLGANAANYTWTGGAIAPASATSPATAGSEVVTFTVQMNMTGTVTPGDIIIVSADQ